MNEHADYLRRLLAQQTESLHAAGVEQIPRSEAIAPADPPPGDREAPGEGITTGANKTPSSAETASAASSATASPAAPTPAAPTPAAPTPAARPDDTGASREEQLRVLRDQVCDCTLCPSLVESRTQTVFGVGNLRPRLCFFGEAPGRDEDLQGEPFVGAAGQLLNKIIQAMTLQRSDVYILNVLKCRPPGNRNPEPDEVANCRPYFERQLKILQPEFICCLGAYAARTLLDTELSVGKLRGRFMNYGDSRVVVTYHPAYLLRNETAKRSTWEDMQMLMREMGLERK